MVVPVSHEHITQLGVRLCAVNTYHGAGWTTPASFLGLTSHVYSRVESDSERKVIFFFPHLFYTIPLAHSTLP